MDKRVSVDARPRQPPRQGSPIPAPGPNPTVITPTERARARFDGMRLMVLAQDDPLDRGTWSGAAHHLFTAMAEVGAEIDGVSGRPPRAAHLAARLLSFSRDRDLLRLKAGIHPVRRWAATAVAWARARRVDPAPDALLQLGIFYEPDRLPGFRPALSCSFHDGNLITGLRGAGLDRARGALARLVGFERAAFDRRDLIFTTSDWLRASFVDDFGQHPDKVVTVGAGPNFHALPKVPKRVGGPPRFLFVGKDFPRKGGPEVLEAFAAVRARHPEAQLWIVGAPDAPDEAPGVTNHGVISRADPHGDARLTDLYSRATAYVMPSRYEPFGFVFLEAMSFGLPCIASAACAMPEIVSDGESGLIVPPRDAAALAAAMTALADDPEGAQRMGAAGRARVEEWFNWRSVAERILAAIAARSPAAGSGR